MYNVSKDYRALYDLINKGKRVICFADYKPHSDWLPARDICVARKSKYNIEFQARGITYGAVDEWEPQTFEYFEGLCRHINIEWVKP